MFDDLFSYFRTNPVDKKYIDLCKRVLKDGVLRKGRNGNTYSLFGVQERFDLSAGLPILTTKKVLLEPIIHELVWFLRGDTKIKYLKDNNVKIWDLWVDSKGDLPYTYPHQWRKFSNPHGKPVDQIKQAIDMIRKNPESRRIIVSAWNPAEIDKAALPWCHTLFQFYVSDNKLSCQLYQRSGDLPLGVPFNWVSYSLLVYVIAKICDLEVGEFIWTAGDLHIYENQVDAIKKQIKVKRHYKMPKVEISDYLFYIDDIEYSDFSVIGYKSNSFIKIPVSK
jgi:thymidylate synthase